MNIFDFFHNDLKSFSRRDFLKYCSTGLSSLFMLPLIGQNKKPGELYPHSNLGATHGRVVSAAVNVYNQPSFSAKLIKSLYQDHVLPITSVTVGDEEPVYNRIWYKMADIGYVHSGVIQPVNIRPNNPQKSVPESGKLAVVTVPYSDAVWNPKSPHLVTYRLYYGTVFWVTKVVIDDNGKTWYKIPDDKWDIQYYADATHLHFIEPEEISPLSPHVSVDDKWIEILLQDQAIIAYEYDRPVFLAKTATGARFIDGDFRTKPGTYFTNRKRPSRHMAAGDPAAPNSYDLPGIPWVTYLTESGISFHGTYWHNDYGKPRSHGCINLTPEDALWIYRWTQPEVPYEMEIRNANFGTRVLVH